MPLSYVILDWLAFILGVSQVISYYKHHGVHIAILLLFHNYNAAMRFKMSQHLTLILFYMTGMAMPHANEMVMSTCLLLKAPLYFNLRNTGP